MGQPDSTIQSCFGGTVYTFDDANSFANTEVPDPLDAEPNLTFDVSRDDDCMGIEVSGVGSTGLPDNPGERYRIDVSCQPHESGSVISIKTTDFNWPSSLDVLEETREQNTDPSCRTLLQAANYFVHRKASDDGWNRLLAIYNGEALSREENKRLKADYPSSPYVRSRFDRISLDLNRDLKSDQYDQGVRAVMAIGHTTIHEQTLWNLFYWILEGTASSDPPQQDDQGEKDTVENENV